MRNRDVVAAWRNDKSAKTAHMRTDGFDLYSYGLKIGFTGQDGYKYAFNYTAKKCLTWIGNGVPGNFVSKTTSCHVGLARRFAFCAPWPKDS